MAEYATIQDVAEEYEGTIPADRLAWATHKLDSAEVVLLGRVKDVPARIAAGKTTAHAVKLVLCNMVIRVLNNPKGFRTQTAGPFSATYEREAASGRLFLSNEDKQLLGLPRARSLPLLDDALPQIIMERPL